MKKNISLIIAASIALGSLGLSGYLYQQLSIVNNELATAQAAEATLQADMVALTSQIEALNATVTEYENEKAAALELEQKEKAERVYVAAMLADELIKKEKNLDQAGLEELLERADEMFTGGRTELRVYFMHGEEFNRVYTKITGEEFNKDEYLESEHAEQIVELSEERKAELREEAAAEMAAFAAEKEAEKAKLEQLEKEKAMLEEAKQQQASGAVKYGHLHTPEELASMRKAEDGCTSLAGKDFSGGTPIVGFN